MKVGGRVRTIRTERRDVRRPWRIHESQRTCCPCKYGSPSRRTRLQAHTHPSRTTCQNRILQHDVRILHHAPSTPGKKTCCLVTKAWRQRRQTRRLPRQPTRRRYVLLHRGGFSALAYKMGKACGARAHFPFSDRHTTRKWNLPRVHPGQSNVDVRRNLLRSPRFMKEWPSIREWIAPQAACVRTAPLHHIYATLKDGTPLPPTLSHDGCPRSDHQWREPVVSGVLHRRKDGGILEPLSTGQPNSVSKLVRDMVKEKLIADVARVRALLERWCSLWVPVYKTPTRILSSVPLSPIRWRFQGFTSREAFSARKGGARGVANGKSGAEPPDLGPSRHKPRLSASAAGVRHLPG